MVPGLLSNRGRRLRFLIGGAGMAVLLVTTALVLILRVLLDGGAEATTGDVFGPSLAYYVTPTPSPTPQPTITPTPRTSTSAGGAPFGRIAIPRFGVNAPIVVLGIDGNGAMETPSGPWEAAWYDFSARPGSGGNAVFSGHVDALYTGRPGPAVFFHLKDLDQGDVIEVRLQEGAVYRYAVVDKWPVDEDTTDLGPIVGRTESEAITLITCGGAGGSQYNQRLIVRAERT